MQELVTSAGVWEFVDCHVDVIAAASTSATYSPPGMVGPVTELVYRMPGTWQSLALAIHACLQAVLLESRALEWALFFTLNVLLFPVPLTVVDTRPCSTFASCIFFKKKLCSNFMHPFGGWVCTPCSACFDGGTVLCRHVEAAWTRGSSVA